MEFPEKYLTDSNPLVREFFREYIQGKRYFEEIPPEIPYIPPDIKVDKLALLLTRSSLLQELSLLEVGDLHIIKAPKLKELNIGKVHRTLKLIKCGELRKINKDIKFDPLARVKIQDCPLLALKLKKSLRIEELFLTKAPSLNFPFLQVGSTLHINSDSLKKLPDLINGENIHIFNLKVPECTIGKANRVFLNRVSSPNVELVVKKSIQELYLDGSGFPVKINPNSLDKIKNIYISSSFFFLS